MAARTVSSSARSVICAVSCCCGCFFIASCRRASAQFSHSIGARLRTIWIVVSWNSLPHVHRTESGFTSDRGEKMPGRSRAEDAACWRRLHSTNFSCGSDLEPLNDRSNAMQRFFQLVMCAVYPVANRWYGSGSDALVRLPVRGFGTRSKNRRETIAQSVR